MKLLITSDNHLGFKETDPIRSEDSFNTFQEIMEIAKQENVDFILQGGDLFDENRPSRNTYNKTLKILKEYCLGGERPYFTASPALNFQNPHLEISMPVLSIHGNHDDPSGFNSVSPLDVLHSSGLINYFGRVESVDEIEVNPILIEGDRKIAIFGIGHIKDRRIQKTFMNKNVIYKRPEGNDWYNILVVHQNRTPREDGYLSEDLIDPFFDLVVYGHEHESIKINHRNFDVIQCGSTIRTSLCEGESMEKYVYILNLTVKNSIKRIELKTIRPLVIESIKVTGESPEQQINRRIESLLTEVKAQHRNGNEMLPLLRLRIDLSGASDFSRQKVQEMVQSKIANPNDAIRIIRKAEKEKLVHSSIIQTFEIKDIFKQLIDSFDLKALVQPKVMESLNDFVEKDIKEAFNVLVAESIKNIVKNINFDDLVSNSIDDAIKTAVEKIKKQADIKESDSEDLVIEVDQEDEFEKQKIEDLCKTIPNPNNSISFNNSSILISKDEFTFVEEAVDKEENKKIIEDVKSELNRVQDTPGFHPKNIARTESTIGSNHVESTRECAVENIKNDPKAKKAKIVASKSDSDDLLDF